MAKGAFFGGGPKGKKGFPMNDAKHDRLAIGGATRSYNAGNISKGKEQAIKAAARSKLGMKHEGKKPRGMRPSESLMQRGHFSNHGKGEISHSEFHALDHGGKGEYMMGRDGKADGKYHDDIAG